MGQPRSRASEEITDLQLQNCEETDFCRSGIHIWFLDRLSTPPCASGQFFFSVLSYSFSTSPCSTYFSVFIYFFLWCIYFSSLLSCPRDICIACVACTFSCALMSREAFSQWVSWEFSMPQIYLRLIIQCTQIMSITLTHVISGSGEAFCAHRLEAFFLSFMKMRSPLAFSFSKQK